MALVTKPCPHCQGSGWRKPVEDTRNLLQKMTFIRCENCEYGRLPDAGDTTKSPK